MSPARLPLRVGLMGFGTVGRAVARMLCEGRLRQLQLVGVCTRRATDRRAEARWVPRDVIWTDDAETLLKTGAEVVVEVIGGVEPACTWIAGALQAGRSVVTANKQVVAEHGPALTALARRAGTALRYEAAVGGVVPVVRGLQDGLGSDHVTRIVGVLNGTCNFVLSEMAEHRVTLAQAVRDAQSRGLAEADPSADLDGIDARAKLAILAAIGFEGYLRPSDIPTESIRTIDAGDLESADRLGCVVRQVASAERTAANAGAVTASVLPALVDEGSWLARAKGPENVVLVTGHRSAQTVFAGQGAGGEATAVAVVSDLLAIAAGVVAPKAWQADVHTPVVRDFTARHYVRVRASRGAAAAEPAAVFNRIGIRPERTWVDEDGEGTRWRAIVPSCSHQRVSHALETLSAAALSSGSLSLPILEAGQ
jgi:homoserine dehydrogenase